MSTPTINCLRASRHENLIKAAKAVALHRPLAKKFSRIPRPLMEALIDALIEPGLAAYGHGQNRDKTSEEVEMVLSCCPAPALSNGMPSDLSDGLPHLNRSE